MLWNMYLLIAATRITLSDKKSQLHDFWLRIGGEEKRPFKGKNPIKRGLLKKNTRGGGRVRKSFWV